MRFQDKVVLVTGASRNTGVGIAALFNREGARVCINGSTSESTAQGGHFLREMGLDGFLETPADIADTAQVRTMFEKIRATYGHIDILVNNACHQGIGPAFEEMEPEYFLSVIKTNLLGTFQVSQEAVKMMLKQESRGVIVNLGSNVSLRAIRKRSAYVASKGGIDALTRAMAIDLGPRGIRVNMVAPDAVFADGKRDIPRQCPWRRRPS